VFVNKAAERARAKRLLDNYKLTPEKWEKINSHQSGVCPICGNASPGGKRLDTDHNHEDGLIRGLLCSRCNPLLGKIENSFARTGHRKIGSHLPTLLLNFALYVTSPPATVALGSAHYGYPGRVGTKAHRKRIRKENK
jgi:hypothetical protein